MSPRRSAEQPGKFGFGGEGTAYAELPPHQRGQKVGSPDGDLGPIGGARLERKGRLSRAPRLGFGMAVRNDQVPRLRVLEVPLDRAAERTRRLEVESARHSFEHDLERLRRGLRL